jgi:hypothetical protein
LAPRKPGPKPRVGETPHGKRSCCERRVNCHRNPRNGNWKPRSSKSRRRGSATTACTWNYCKPRRVGAERVRTTGRRIFQFMSVASGTS